MKSLKKEESNEQWSVCRMVKGQSLKQVKNEPSTKISADNDKKCQMLKHHYRKTWAANQQKRLCNLSYFL